MKRNITLLILFLIVSHTVYSQNWMLYQYRPDLEFNDAKFITATDGIALADSSVNGIDVGTMILKTTDGGQSWNIYPLSNASYELDKCFFLNSSEGFAAGRNGGGNNGLMLKTNDGGITWHSPSNFPERLFNVCFVNSTTGWVMGNNGFLSHTTDGGTTWQQITLTGEDINAMQFFNSLQGIMACDNGELYGTVDGGLTWNTVANPAQEDLSAIAIVNNEAWICGDAGTIIHSSDAGLTWTLQPAAVVMDFNDISFANASFGFTAGLAGTVNHTQNGGMLWQNNNSNTLEEIIAIAIPDVNHGWFFTETGYIYSFSNITGLHGEVEQLPVIYPNPVANKFTINMDYLYIDIYDVAGKLCLTHHVTNNPSEVPVSDLPPGLYNAVIVSTKVINNLKFIKTP